MYKRQDKIDYQKLFDIGVFVRNSSDTSIDVMATVDQMKEVLEYFTSRGGSESETPEVETPEVETPEVETPEVETPEVETPEVETPEVNAGGGEGGQGASPGEGGQGQEGSGNAS